MQLLYNCPQIYDYNLPEGFLHDNFNLLLAMKNQCVQAPPWNHYAILPSEGGQQFASFAKSASYNQGNKVTQCFAILILVCSFCA
jgi:hypothetical protein